MVDVGAVVSVDALAATSPGMRVAGWAPMSARMLTVPAACRGSGAVPLPSWLVVEAPRPLDGAGAEDQRAARGAVVVRWWVAVAGPTVLP